MSKQLNKRILISFVHGLWMTLLVFLWLRQPFILDYEFNITKDINDIEWALRMGKVNGKDDYINRFLFVDVSQSFELNPKALSGHPNIRTNRQQLLEFLSILERHTDMYEVLVLDVFINNLESKTDTLLFNSVRRLKNQHKIVTVNEIYENYYHKGKEQFYSKLMPNAFGDKLSGPVFYSKSQSDAYYKFKYQIKPDDGDLQKQLPLLAYECIAHKTSSKPYFFDIFYRYNNEGSYHQNIYIPRIVLNSEDLILDTNNDRGLAVNTIYLNDIFDYEEAILPKLDIAPKPIIILGDLQQSDIHYSTNGIIRGPLIIANTMIPLLEQGNKLRLQYILFLWLTFTLVSYLTFYPHGVDRLKKRPIKYPVLQWIRDNLINQLNYFILIIATLIGVFFFNHYIFFLFNAIYIFLLEKLLKFMKNKTIQHKKTRPYEN